MYKKVFLSLAFSLFFISLCFSQTELAKKNLIESAEEMGEAFIANDFIKFTKYIYPQVLAIVGGEKPMIDQIRKSVLEMGQKGMKVTRISFDSPSEILQKFSELQATIVQRMEIQTPTGELIKSKTLIAISLNRGESWTFLDSSGKDIETLRKMFPNLSDRLNTSQE